MDFKRIEPKALDMKPFYDFDKGWALLSAGNADGFNTMTVSWGGVGTLWSKPVATVYVRPQRYTREFIEREAYYTLSLFGGEHREALTLLGKESGRDGDKLAKTDLTASFEPKTGAPVFEQAQINLVCRKLYADDIKAEQFIDDSLIKHIYPTSDFHRIYIGEVIAAFARK